MKRINLFYVGMILIVSCSAAWADLASGFDGFSTVWEVGVSGLRSSYYTQTKSGTTLPDNMFSLSSHRVTYPYGVGQVPSPGGYLGSMFDVGAIGVQNQGGNLVIQVASALNPSKGYYLSWWNTWHSLGDVFITVEDTSGINHFALLNSWPTNGASYRTIGSGYYNAAMDFHTQGGAGGTSLEGHLVSLSENGDIIVTGGPGSYYPANFSSPHGLDFRVYAQDGDDIGDAGLVQSSIKDSGLCGFEQDWFIQTWTIPIDWLSTDPVFAMGLHTAMSCSNDQIGMLTNVVPLPGAVVLGLAGLSVAGFLVRGRRKRI